MKFFISTFILLLTLTETFAHNPRHIEALNRRERVKPGSIEFIHFNQRAYIDRISFKARRNYLAGTSRKAGKVEISANGRVLDCINFYTNTSTRWRTYVLEVGASIDTLEFYNFLDTSVVIKDFKVLPRRVGGGLNSCITRGDCPTGLSEISSYLSQIEGSIIILKDFTTSEEYTQSLMPIRIKSSKVMNLISANGSYSQGTRKALEELLALIEASEAVLERLREGEFTYPFVQDIDFSYKVIKAALN